VASGQWSVVSENLARRPSSDLSVCRCHAMSVKVGMVAEDQKQPRASLNSGGE
jgi:hypothetical protein